jgi:hypothetical protein
VSLADFMASAPAPAEVPGPMRPAWVIQLEGELRRVVRTQAERSDRTLQVHLGPSEIGSECDREVAGKLAGFPRTNHVADPWPSVVGTATHAWLADAFTADGPRWLAEQRVTPAPDAPPEQSGHTGTADLYDIETSTLVDHKVLGRSTHAKLVSHGPGWTYRRQLLLYSRGYKLAGLPVKRVALAAWPRAGSTLSGLHVWGLELDDETEAETDNLLRVTMPRRYAQAAALMAGAGLPSVPATPDDHCYFCPFYRPSDPDTHGTCSGRVARS